MKPVISIGCLVSRVWFCGFSVWTGVVGDLEAGISIYPNYPDFAGCIASWLRREDHYYLYSAR